MIKTKNQWVCKFDIADYNDFILQDDFIELLYVEDASMALPTIELKFIIRDLDILGYLNQGSILTVGFGKDEVSMLDLKFRIVTDFSNKRPSVGQIVSVGGIYYDTNFISNKETINYESMTSLEVVQAEAKKYFPLFKTNIEKTNDRQNWYKHDTGWNFLKKVCNNGFVDTNTFMLSAFDNNTFYYYDYIKLLKDATESIQTIPIFSKSRASDNIINYGVSNVSCDSGVTSKALGNQQVVVEYDWQNYTIKMCSDNLVSLTSIDTNSIPIMDDGSLSTAYKGLFSSQSGIENIATTQNFKNKLLTSNVQIFITFGGQFKKLSLLDVVLIDETGDPRIIGLAIVSRIAYQIVDNNLYTNITLIRESFNNIKGSDLQTV